LVKHKADVQACDEFRATPLHYASLHGKAEVVQYLLKRGALVDAVDEEGLTALHMALEDGHDDVVDALIAFKADTNVASAIGLTPLHYAAERGRVDAVRRLIAAGARTDVVDRSGSTPLHTAAFHGHVDIIEALLAAGAPVDADVQVCNGGTGTSRKAAAAAAVAAASRRQLSSNGKSGGEATGSAATTTTTTTTTNDDDSEGSKKSSKKIALSTDDPENSSEDLVAVYDTPLHHAAHQGQAACLKVLLMAGADVDARDAAGASALHKACFNEHVECVRLLVEAGASIGAADVEGSTALHRAAHSGNVDCVRLLIEHKADVRAFDSSRGTPLHNASYAGRRDVLLLLIDAGAAVDAADEAGNSALHLAMHQSQRDCGKVLVSRGADPKLRNKKGMTPLHYAVNDHKCLKLLLDLGCSVDSRDERGRAPLFYAVRGTCEDAVRLLVQHGADVRAVDKKGKSASDVATKDAKRWLARFVRERDDAARVELVRRFRRAVPPFNEHPKRGIAWAVEQGVLASEAPADVAEFLHVAEELNKTKVGQFIADKDEKSAAVRRAFMDRMDFAGLSVAEGLRELMTRFRLPGEAQQIDRCMESFASSFFASNPTAFGHQDTAYILSVAIIMLNTDAHNDNIATKMTKAEWLKNCRGIDQGRDLPRDYLEKIYDDVCQNEIKMDTRDTAAVSRKGYLTKQGGRIKTWKKRWFVVSDGCLYYFKAPGDKEPLGIIPLENVDVRESKKKKYCFELWQADNNTMKAAKIAADGSIQRGHHDSYALAASTAEEMRDWIDAIERCVCQNPFQRLIDRRLAAVATTESAATSGASASSGGASSAALAGSGASALAPEASILGSLQADFEEMYKHVGMCRLATKPESYLRKKFGDTTVVMRRHHLSAFMSLDRDAKRQYIVVCPEDLSALRRLHRAWAPEGTPGLEEDSGSTSSVGNKVAAAAAAASTSTVAAPPAPAVDEPSISTEQYNNDGSSGVGGVSAEEIRLRTSKIVKLTEASDDLFNTFAPLVDKSIFLTVIAYSVAAWPTCHLALRLKNTNCRLRLVQTFGAPRFVPPTELSHFSGLPISRVRVVDDPVPLQLFPGMRHIGLPVILLKGQYYSQLPTPASDAEELQALQPTSRPMLDAQHHLDEYAELIRIKRKVSTKLDYRSPDRLKHSI
jgi:cytohesin